jgi:predicted dithiol-disulfide oxidoreductase (DUF899 family)
MLPTARRSRSSTSSSSAPGAVHHFCSSELNSLEADQGQNPRHIDLMWPLRNVLDLTPEGRGTDWFPKHAYSTGQ